MSKVFLITGTRKGIGKALAEHYLSKDFIVAGCSRGNSAIDHKNYTHYSLDISDEKAVVRMCRDVEKKHKKIDVLLNNAGVASMNHLLLTPLKSVEQIFKTNFFGTFLLLREVSKIMSRKKHGRIINFSTVARPLRTEGESIYASSKAAVECLTEIAARELAPLCITVNGIGPTPLPTSLIRTVPKEKIDAVVNRQAIKRMTEIEDIVNVIDFFSDEKSHFITGQIIYLGGVTA